MRVWRTIDSAPMDGTVIDLWLVDQDGTGDRVPDAQYVKDFPDWRIEYNPDGSSREVYFRRSGWVAYNEFEHDMAFCDASAEVTHWMPRPEAPEAEGGDGQ